MLLFAQPTKYISFHYNIVCFLNNFLNICFYRPKNAYYKKGLLLLELAAVKTPKLFILLTSQSNTIPYVI